MSTPPEFKEGSTPKQSNKFCASDANVTFVSCDNVLFHIHRKNLESNTTGFPSAEFDARGEIVPLTEDAATLELLFQYVYPQRHPSLVGIPVSTLAPLSEAAEKYQVFAAMNICHFRMKNSLPNHAVEIFNYASRHDYAELIGDAAQSLLDLPLDEIVKTLSTHLIIPWICYREAWSRTAFKAISTLRPHSEHCDRRQPVCNSRKRTYEPGKIWMSLGEKRSRAALYGLFTTNNVASFCPYVDQKAREHLEKELNSFPGFNTFL